MVSNSGVPKSLCLSLVVCLGLVLSVSAQKPRPAPAAPPVSTTPSAADVEAITGAVQGYFAALNARDLDAGLRLWHEKSPEAAVIKQTMPQVFEARDPLWSDVEVAVLSVEGTRARARVLFKVELRRPPPQVARPPITTRDVMELTRVGTAWRLFAEKSESQDTAERLIAAPDDAALTRIFTEERDQMTLNMVRALLGVAAYAAAQQKWDTAITGYSRAIRLAEAPVVPLTENEKQANMAEMHLATALSGLAQALIAKPQPDVPRAIELLTRSLDLSERTNSEVGVINTLQALGNAYYTAGEYAEALDRYQRVLPVAAKQQDTDAIARTNLGIGNVQYLFGQYDLARAAYASSVEIYDTARDQDALPRALQGLGRVFAATGDFDAARAQFQRALTLLARTIQKSDQAGVMCDLGRLDFQQGRLADARTQFQNGLTLAESITDAFNIGRAQYSLGLVDAVERNFDSAVERYTRAAEALMRMAPPNTDSAGQAILARASVRFEQRDLPRALEDFTTCFTMFEKIRNREGMARASLGLAMVHRRNKDAKLALDVATRAYDLGERAAAPDVRWQARYEAGQGWLLAGNAVRARQAFEEAIRILEDTRFEGGADAEAQAPSQRAAPYVALVESHIARGDATAALIAADAAKRRMIEDLLRPFNFRLTRGLAPERQAEERRLVNQRVTLFRQVRRERDLPKPNTARIAKLEQSLAAARASNLEWNQALARDLPAVAYQRGSATLTSLDPLAAVLAPDAALVHFIVGDDRTSVIVATHAKTEPEGRGDVAPAPPEAAAIASATAPRAEALAAPLDVFAFTVPVTRAQLADQVWRFTEGIAQRADTVTADARALYDLLLAPARERLAGRATLVVVPDDALWTLPFEALMPADDRYLIQNATITAVPSAATWVAQPPPASAATSTASSVNGSPADAGTWRSAFAAWAATGEFSDTSPLQTRLTFVTGDLPPLRPDTPEPPSAAAEARPLPEGATPQPDATSASRATTTNATTLRAEVSGAGSAPAVAGTVATPRDATNPATQAGATLAAWELFDREAGADEVLLADVRPKAERLRLDAGRLGATGLYWALQVAGARRVVVARRGLPTDVQVATTLPLPHPYEWATWLVMGPPQAPIQPAVVSQPAQVPRLPQ